MNTLINTRSAVVAPTAIGTCAPWTFGPHTPSARAVFSDSALGTDAQLRTGFRSAELWAANIDTPMVGVAVANGSYKAVQAASGIRPRGTPL